MTITNASKILVKNNINRKFFWFAVKKNPIIFSYLFILAFNYLISIVTCNNDYYIERQFCYFKKIKNLEKTIEKFNEKIIKTNFFYIEPDYIIEKTPAIILKELFKGYKIIGYHLNKQFHVELDEFNKDIKKVVNVDKIYINKRKKVLSVKFKELYIVNNRKCYRIETKKDINSNLLNIGILFFLANLITIMSFFFANANFTFDFFKSYFEIGLYFMNFIPIFVIMIFTYLFTGRVHLSFAFIFIIVLVLGISNQTKLTYRDDIVKFEDLIIIKEALIMSQKYDVVIKKYTIAFLIMAIPCFFLLRYKLSVFKLKLVVKVSLIIPVLAFLVLGYKHFYSKNSIYDKLGDKSLINVWIATRQYQIRGMVYPFIYTIKDAITEAPDGYTEKKAIDVLKEYTYENIPEEKKVNVIAIMFEAFNDFSKFEEIEFTSDIYEKFHSIEKESISGSIVTQIFGGGTVVTERNFLTGYYDLPTFRKPTNSFIWYFKEQGYNTEAMHPIYGAFYNRSSANINIGFDVYYNYENRYKFVQEDLMWDDHYFLNDIIAQFEKNKLTDKPYFNFSVTYQNHGPYLSENYDNKPYYIKKGNMTDEGYNIINQYFVGISDTVDAMYEFINYFKNEKEPTIIIMFGDHNPYLGENALSYRDLGINMDVSTLEGFKNYYSTPYIIYGNPSAKKIFNKSFVGKGEEISAIFLMNELFDYVGLKGNQYMQYLSAKKAIKPVVSPVYEKVNGEYIISESNDEKKEYNIVSYYVSNNYRLQK